jgi:hypothetical protein
VGLALRLPIGSRSRAPQRVDETRTPHAEASRYWRALAGIKPAPQILHHNDRERLLRRSQQIAADPIDGSSGHYQPPA